jgi:hypothetical protein
VSLAATTAMTTKVFVKLDQRALSCKRHTRVLSSSLLGHGLIIGSSQERLEFLG